MSESITSNQTIIMLKLIKSKIDTKDYDGATKITKNLIKQIQNKEKVRIIV